MKLTVHATKKIGLRGYGSQSFGGSLEIELREGTPEEVASTYRAAVADLRRLIEEQIGAERETTNGNGSNGNGNGRNNGTNGRSEQGPRNAGSASEVAISPKQMRFIRGLSAKAKLRPSDLDARIREMFSAPNISLRDLTKRQASEVIDALQEEAAAV